MSPHNDGPSQRTVKEIFSCQEVLFPSLSREVLSQEEISSIIPYVLGKFREAGHGTEVHFSYHTKLPSY